MLKSWYSHSQNKNKCQCYRPHKAEQKFFATVYFLRSTTYVHQRELVASGSGFDSGSAVNHVSILNVDVAHRPASVWDFFSNTVNDGLTCHSPSAEPGGRSPTQPSSGRRRWATGTETQDQNMKAESDLHGQTHFMSSFCFGPPIIRKLSTWLNF